MNTHFSDRPRTRTDKTLFKVLFSKALSVLLFSVLAASVIGCGSGLVGSGPTITQGLSIQGVQRIIVHDSLNVHISYSEQEKADLSGHTNLLPYFKYEQEGDTLNLRLHHGAQILEGDLTVVLALPRLRELRVVDGSRVHLKRLETRGDLRLDFSGMSDIRIDLHSDAQVDIDINGSSRVQGQLRANVIRWKLTGNSRALARVHTNQNHLDASGSSWVEFVGESNLFQVGLSGGSKGFFSLLKAQEIDAHLSGASQGIVSHDGSLRALLEGASKLFCRGQPHIEKLDTTGGSVLEPIQ